MTRSSVFGSDATDPLARVSAFLTDHGLADRVVRFPQGATKTSQDAATVVGCELGQVVKSLVFVAGGEPVLALVAGDRRGDPEAIGRLVGTPDVRLADPGTVWVATGYEVGGVSPFDLPGALRVVADDSLTRFDTVYTAAGTPETMVRLGLDELLGLVGATMARISR